MSSTLPKYYYTRVPTRQYDPNLTGSYIIGRRHVVSATSGSSRDTYTMTFTGSLIKIGIHQSVYTDQDWWHLSGSDWQLFDTIYSKPSIPESFVLEIGKTLSSGSDIIFEFYNSSATSKNIWIDLYFIR